jgi:hypothetical protein
MTTLAALRQSLRASLRSGLIGRLALLAGSSLLALLVAELILRFFVPIGSFRHVGAGGASWSRPDDRLAYVPTAGYRGRVEAPEFNHEVRINQWGLRGAEPQLENNLILLAGDSFVFGIGVPEDQTIGAQLGGALGERFEVLNLGVPGYSTQQYRLRLEAILEKLDRLNKKPRAIIVCFYLGAIPSGANDLTGAVEFEKALQAVTEQSEGTRAPSVKGRSPWLPQLKKRLLRSSALYNFVILRVGPSLRAWNQRGLAVDPQLLERGWKIFEGELGHLRALAEARESRLIAVYLPEATDLINHRHDIAERFVAVTAAAGIEAIAASSFLQPTDYFPLDGHLNATGCATVAAELGRRLIGEAASPAATTSATRSLAAGV